MMKHNKLVIFATAAVLLVSSLCIYGNTLLLSPVRGQASTIISYNYEGIDEGLNPHGGSFDIEQVKNNNVLEQTITTLGLDVKGITAEVLGQHIILKPYVPEDILARILPKASSKADAQTQALDGQSYHPTQYRITLQDTKELGLSKKELQTVVDTLVTTYTQDFIDRYKDTQALETAIKPIDPARYDYAEYMALAEGQLDIIQQYVVAKEQKAGKFVSETTGLSFSDLNAQITLLRDIEVSSVKALIDTFMITKNKDELQAVYSNRLSNLHRDKELVAKQKATVNQALATYEKDPTVILENGQVITGAYIDEEEEVTLYDQLIQQSIALDAKYNSIAYQIKYYEELLAKLVAGAGANVPVAYEQEVKDTIAYLSGRISQLVADATQTADDYYVTEAFEKSVSRTEAIRYTSAFRMKLIKNTAVVGIITLFGMILAIIVALGLEIKRAKK